MRVSSWNTTPGADVEVSYLRVAHLPLGQAHGPPEAARRVVGASANRRSSTGVAASEMALLGPARPGRSRP